MPAPAPSAPHDEPAPRWSLLEALLGALAALIVSAVLGSVVVAVSGLELGEGESVTDVASLRLVALLQATLWIGMAGVLVVLVARRGGSLVDDLRLRFRAADVPLGILLGVACQLVLVPLVSAPWVALLGEDADQLKEPACILADKADDAVGVVLLFLITVVGAPVVEELFFRGLVQRAAVARLGRPVGVLVSAGVFGLAHFQTLQAPALVAFGLVLGFLADRTGRLGPSIVTHMAFNATTVIALVALSGSDCDAVLGLVLR